MGLLSAQGAQKIPDWGDNVQTTPSGLKYCVLKKGGEEPGPGANDRVEVHYTGWLVDGKKFDSSRDGGQPASFQVGGVIKGWTEALQLMTPGARFKLEIPPDLGYGAQDQGAIPPNSTLIFEVELLKVTRMPVLPPGNKEQRKPLPCGLEYEVVKAGAGAAAGSTEAVAFKYAIFKSDGTLLQCSEQQNNHLIGGTKDTLQFDFMKDLFDLMKQGDVARIEVPTGKVRSFPFDTVWVLDLVGVHKLPKFRALDAAKTVTTQSGLKYEVIRPGDGNAPKATDTVSALYTGWLTDGSVFDSAHGRGMPTEFPLSGVIKGWTEGLQLMKEGGAFLFEIPADLAYGARGQPPRIPASATLIFLVELVAVK